jgi:hypothetical protein
MERVRIPSAHTHPLEHAMSPTTTMSWEDYQKLPEDISIEYVDGQAVVNPPPTRRHQRAARRMANLIEAVDPSAVSVETEWGWKPGDDEFVPDVLVTRPTHEELRYTGALRYLWWKFSRRTEPTTSERRDPSTPLPACFATGLLILKRRP